MKKGKDLSLPIKGGKFLSNMESIALEKFNGLNFHTWKVKTQLQMISRNLWSIVKGTERAPTDARQLNEWEKR